MGLQVYGEHEGSLEAGDIDVYINIYTHKVTSVDYTGVLFGFRVIRVLFGALHGDCVENPGTSR